MQQQLSTRRLQTVFYWSSCKNNSHNFFRLTSLSLQHFALQNDAQKLVRYNFARSLLAIHFLSMMKPIGLIGDEGEENEKHHFYFVTKICWQSACLPKNERNVGFI